MNSEHHEKKDRLGWHWLLAVATALLGIMVFAPALTYDFVYDDLVEIRRYEETFSGSPWNLLFMVQSRLYRPVKYLTLYLDRALWGWNPAGFHLMNLILHGAVCALLFLLFRGLGFSKLGGIIGAFWFAVHPIHTESVVWISARSSMLSALGVLGFLYFYLRWREKGRYGFLLAGVVFCLVGVFSKEDALMVLPLLGALELFYPLPTLDAPVRKKRLIIALISAAVPAILYVVVRLSFMEGVAQAEAALGLGDRVLRIPALMARDIGQLVYPAIMTVDHPVGGASLGIGFWLGIVTMVVLLSPFFIRRERRSFLKFSVAWFFLFLAPVCGLVPINQPFADRFLYLPSVAGGMALSGLWDVISRHRQAWKRVFLIAWGALIVVYMIRGVLYESTWKNGETLWNHAVRINPASFRGWNNLAVLANNRGHYGKGLALSNKALDIKAGYVEAKLAKAFALDRLGRHEQALAMYRKSLLMNPENTQALYLFADFLERRGRLEEADGLYDRIFRIRPGFVEARIAAGVLNMKMGNKKKAISLWEKALEFDPDNQMARHNLLRARREQGKDLSREKTSHR